MFRVFVDGQSGADRLTLVKRGIMHPDYNEGG